MSAFDDHRAKYEMFKQDADNENNSIPTRVQAYFNSSFHLIESVAVKYGIHIQKHQRVRSTIEENWQVFKNNTEEIWKLFQEIENQIRPGQIYGGAINGPKIKRAIKLFKIIENICKEAVEK